MAPVVALLALGGTTDITTELLLRAEKCILYHYYYHY
jgi:hypothetical protein